MNKYAILRTQKLKQFSQVAGVGNHNHRKTEVLNANPKYADRNENVNPKKDLVQEVKERIGDQKIRKNGVLAFETVLTFSPDWWNSLDLVDRDKKVEAFKKQSLRFLEEKFGEGNVVDFVVHRDETTPHIHAVVVPIDPKGKLNCRHFLGGKEKLSKLQTDFASAVSNLGLERGRRNSKAKHTTIKKWYGYANADIQKAQKNAKKVEEEMSKIEQPSRISNPLKIYEQFKNLFEESQSTIRRLERVAKNSVRKNQELREENQRLHKKVAEQKKILKNLHLKDFQKLDLAQQEKVKHEMSRLVKSFQPKIPNRETRKAMDEANDPAKRSVGYKDSAKLVKRLQEASEKPQEDKRKKPRI